jgi:aminoglycoside phosphotransferase (APT) family kinase protein
MASQPPTLLHGGCRPTNILVKVASDPSRVCIIDWEEAAFGSPLYDVAYLLDGFEPPTLDRLLDAYRQEALAFDISLPPKEDMKYIVNCFRLHMVMNSLSQAALKGYKEKGIVKLLDIGKHLSHVVTMQVQ